MDDGVIDIGTKKKSIIKYFKLKIYSNEFT